MKDLPASDRALLLRADFADDATWAALLAAVREPQREEGFQAEVLAVSDREYDGSTVDQLLSLARRGRFRSYLLVADRTTIAHPDRPVLVIDLSHQPGPHVPRNPSCMWSVENNLSLANMDFSDFFLSLDRHGTSD